MTEVYPVAPGHEVPLDEWKKIVAEVEAEASRRSFAAPSTTSSVIDVGYTGSPYKDSGPLTSIQLWIVHTIECPLAPGYAKSMANWGKTSSVQASWHDTIGPELVCKFIPYSLRAWHATRANPISLGFEQTGYAAYTRERWLQPDGMAVIDRLAKRIVDSGIPKEAVRLLTSTEAQAARDGNKSIKGICGHVHVQPADRTDPGAGYPWDVLLDSIRKYHPAFATTTGGFLMALTDKQQTDLYNRIMGGIPAGSAEGRFNPDGSPARVFDSGDGDYLRQLIELVLGRQLTAEAIAQAIPDGIAQGVIDRLAERLGGTA